MSNQPPGSLHVELAEAGVRIVARLKDGRTGAVTIPVHLAEELAEGIIQLVRDFERRKAAKLGWDVT
jgi:hypothetical protein